MINNWNRFCLFFFLIVNLFIFSINYIFKNKYFFMKHILVVCALSQELNVVKKEIRKYKIPNLKIDFLQTWMWNYNTIFSLTKKLESKKYDFIINVWVSGYFWEKKEDFYQIWNILNIFTEKELIVPTYFKFWQLSTCLSSETGIIWYNKEKEWLIKDEKIYVKKNKMFDIYGNFDYNFFLVDMESFGFEFVMEKYGIPRIILKVPVDKIWFETENFSYKKSLELLKNNINYEKLLFEIKKYLETIEINDIDLEKYFSFFYFSKNQKEKFLFLYRKYKILVWKDFDDFYNLFLEENKEKTNKKQIWKLFLEKLETYLQDKIY